MNRSMNGQKSTIVLILFFSLNAIKDEVRI